MCIRDRVDDAYNAVADIVADGGTILFVGTKKQAQDAIKTEAERCGMFYVNERWLGGMLTNFKTIQSRIGRLKEIEAMEADGTFDVLDVYKRQKYYRIPMEPEIGEEVKIRFRTLRNNCLLYTSRCV